MRNLLENTKVKMIVLCLALAASFMLGYSMGNPSSEMKNGIKIDRVSASMLEEAESIGLRLINCKQAIDRGKEPAPFLYQELRITSGAMIARIYDGYGEPDYDRASLNYLFGLAHHLNKIALENLTEDEWNELFVDAKAVIDIYRMNLQNPYTLLDELDKLLEGKSFPAKFNNSYTILDAESQNLY